MTTTCSYTILCLGLSSSLRLQIGNSRSWFGTRQKVASAATSVTERRAWRAVIGSLVFFVVAPGTVAGWIPFRLTNWRMQPPLLAVPGLRVVGATLLVVGLVSLVESFLRFAIVGLGTPAPVAPPTRLVISGQYRHVRNPMYVAVLAIVIGQSLVLGSVVLLRYAVLVWLVVHAFVLLYEEPALKAQFGPSYDAYRENVGRWWPRIRPWRG
jgi:protein-S-isoprenylcysteine O-methyltransferase Ste14